MTTAATGTSSTTSSSATVSKPDAFDPAAQKDLFLQLLVAQLKNQDPTSPMDQKEMMGQMAQMTSVEQMANMAKSMERLEAVSTIGKTVDYNRRSQDATQPAELVEGAVVKSVKIMAGKTVLSFEDGSMAEYRDVVQVR